MQPFVERRIRFAGVKRGSGWSMKTYSVQHDEGTVDWDGFEVAFGLALDTLPPPDPDGGRPGLGFFIAHQGRTGDYGVLAWWNHENELPLAVWLRRERTDAWRAAAQGESVCVWDLEVLWEERQAWVETMLSRSGPDPDAYLARVPARFLDDHAADGVTETARAGSGGAGSR